MATVVMRECFQSNIYALEMFGTEIDMMNDETFARVKMNHNNIF